MVQETEKHKKGQWYLRCGPQITHLPLCGMNPRDLQSFLDRPLAWQ